MIKVITSNAINPTAEMGDHRGIAPEIVGPKTEIFEGEGLEIISEKSILHPHGLLRAGYPKCYFAHLLYIIK